MPFIYSAQRLSASLLSACRLGRLAAVEAMCSTPVGVIAVCVAARSRFRRSSQVLNACRRHCCLR